MSNTVNTVMLFFGMFLLAFCLVAASPSRLLATNADSAGCDSANCTGKGNTTASTMPCVDSGYSKALGTCVLKRQDGEETTWKWSCAKGNDATVPADCGACCCSYPVNPQDNEECGCWHKDSAKERCI